MKNIASFLFILFLSLSTLGQDTRKPVEGLARNIVTDETYQNVLDLIFPLEIKQKKATIWQLVLRFQPTFNTESQIVIRKTFDDVEIIQYRVANGTVFKTLSEWRTKNIREDVLEMSKLIKVDRRHVEVSAAETNSWLKGFFNAIPRTTQSLEDLIVETERTNSWSVPLHGTTYQLWFTFKGNQINLAAKDDEIDKTKISGISPIVKWMNKIKIQIDKQK